MFCHRQIRVLRPVTKNLAVLLLGTAAMCIPSSCVLAQESILSVVQQREQAANQNRTPSRRKTTTKVEDTITGSQNLPIDYGSKTNSKPQYVRGLRGLQRNSNNAIATKRAMPLATGTLTAPAPASVSRPYVTNGSGQQQLGPNPSLAAPGLPSIQPTSRNAAQNADPYAPDGIRVGNINVLPFVGASGGYNTNPASASTKPKGSPLYQVEGGVTAQSDWTTHSFNADLRGIYTDYTGVKGANQPELNARIGGRIDLSRDTQIDLETRAKLTSESVSDVNLPAGVTQRPNTYSYGSSLGGTQRFGRMSVSLRGSVDRSTYDSATAGTTTIDQSDRNQNTYALRLRAGYELSPGITPFVDVTVDTRQFDKTVDRSGFRRDSNGLTGRVGTSFELTRTLTGEVAVGYGSRSFADSKLNNLNGIVTEGNLIWSLSPLTAIRLRAISELQDTTTAGASGVISRRAGLDVEHALFRNLSLGASTEIGRSTTQGVPLTQDTITAGLRADYKLTKEVVFRTSYTFQRLSANYSGGSYSSHLVLFGLRLQR